MLQPLHCHSNALYRDEFSSKLTQHIVVYHSSKVYSTIIDGVATDIPRTTKLPTIVLATPKQKMRLRHQQKNLAVASVMMEPLNCVRQPPNSKPGKEILHHYRPEVWKRILHNHQPKQKKRDCSINGEKMRLPHQRQYSRQIDCKVHHVTA